MLAVVLLLDLHGFSGQALYTKPCYSHVIYHHISAQSPLGSAQHCLSTHAMQPLVQTDEMIQWSFVSGLKSKTFFNNPAIIGIYLLLYFAVWLKSTIV